MRKLMATAAICGLIAVMALTAMASAQSTSTPTLKAAKSTDFGTILTDANGMALYTYDKDKPNQSNCNDADCLSEWPPLIASGQLTLASGMPGKISAITRTGGIKQVAYNGMPLYTFTGDQKPGDAAGDGVDEFSIAIVPGSKPAPEPAVKVASTTLTVRDDGSTGTLLADAAGRTLYMFASDKPGQSACTGECAENWPALTTKSTTLTLPSGVSGQLGTITRQDGSKQVTFNGKPLYYFAGDKRAGETNGKFFGSKKGFSIAQQTAGSAAPAATAPSDDNYNSYYGN